MLEFTPLDLENVEQVEFREKVFQTLKVVVHDERLKRLFGRRRGGGAFVHPAFTTRQYMNLYDIPNETTIT